MSCGPQCGFFLTLLLSFNVAVVFQHFFDMANRLWRESWETCEGMSFGHIYPGFEEQTGNEVAARVIAVVERWHLRREEIPGSWMWAAGFGQWGEKQKSC